MFRLLFLVLLPIVASQRAASWDRCHCYWETWKAWSKCSKECYGEQIRERRVWHDDIPSCHGFESCDAGAGGWEQTQCNKHCDAGYYNGYRCACPTGRYGVCCENVVTCARPNGLLHGTVHGSRFQYDDVITYVCDQSYNLTGLFTRKCLETGGWSGAKPRCQFAESCKSNPCQNNGTCINGLDRYDCHCQTGWSGKNCEVDIQPPLFDHCSSNVTLYVSDRTTNYTWQAPNFKDPHGTPVKTSSNYPINSFIFPWGDHTIQYRGVKESNGLETTCIFTISVRPKQCPALTPPINGYIVSNGWRADYGQFCLIGCNTNYTLPGSFDPRQWLVCGASGHWSTTPIPKQCEDALIPESGEVVLRSGNCHDDMSRQKEDYIEALKRSSYNSFCISHPALCLADNVRVLCGA